MMRGCMLSTYITKEPSFSSKSTGPCSAFQEGAHVTRRENGNELLALWQEAIQEGQGRLRCLVETVLRDMPEAEITDSETLEETIKALQGAFGELSEEYPDIAQMLEEEGDEMLVVWRRELHGNSGLV